MIYPLGDSCLAQFSIHSFGPFLPPMFNLLRSTTAGSWNALWTGSVAHLSHFRSEAFLIAYPSVCLDNMDVVIAMVAFLIWGVDRGHNRNPVSVPEV
jgi:hypothetical protein